MEGLKPVNRLLTNDRIPVPPYLFSQLAAFGVNMQAVFERSRITPAQSTFSTTEQMAFWSALAELAPTRDIGLRLGRDRTPEQWNLAELAVLHAPNFEAGLKRLARYKRLVCSEEVILCGGQDEIRIGFHWMRAPGPVPPMLLECVFAALLKIVEQASNERLVPRRIEWSRRHPDITETQFLSHHFGCAMMFDAPDDRLVLASSDLARKFHLQDAERFARLLPILEAGVVARAPTFTDEVRHSMGKRMVGEPITIASIALDFACTPRTLQRRLAREGTAYQTLLDEVRRATAQRLLVATELLETEVAFFLGFEEANSFRRAFRKWEGVSPRCWRQKVAGTTLRTANATSEPFVEDLPD